MKDDDYEDKIKCEDCGTTVDVEYTECPFDQELYGKVNMCWLCPGCEHERAMDI